MVALIAAATKLGRHSFMSLIKSANDKGFRVWRDGDLLAVSPLSKLTDADKEWFTVNKQDFLIELAGDDSQVGYTLQEIIKRTVPQMLLNKVQRGSCGCESFAKQMNSWGINGCVENESQILDHLVKQSDVFGIAVKLMPRRAIAKRLLDRAIAIERKKQRRAIDGMRRKAVSL